MSDLLLLDLPDVLHRLNYTPTEHLSICHKRDSGPFTARTMASPKACTDGHQTDDVWFGVNPINPGAKGRGKTDEVMRMAALYADLDVKADGCPDFDVCRTITDVLSDMLTSRPVVLTYSGHGLQPIWAIDPEDPGTNLNGTSTARAELRALLRRFGRLVAAVAERHHASVDSVFDLTRVLRAPGSTNYKDRAHPVEVLTFADTGHPITLTELREALDAYGIASYPEDFEELGTVITPPADWEWAPTSCNYTINTIKGWATDTPKGRHPWLVSNAVRLSAMHAHGCITQADHNKAAATITTRFAQLLATVAPIRKASPGEVSQAFGWGQAHASCMDPARIAKEVGNRHTHELQEGAAGPFGTVGATTPAPVEQAPTQPEPDPGAGLRRVILTSAADIKPRPVFWIWKNRLALGTIGLLAGREGTGKSTLAYWITARLTQGDLFGIYHGTPKAVLVCATEDSWEHTIVPRLIAAGADRSKVFRVEVVNADDIQVGLSLPRDLLAVERAAQQTGAALLLLDPLMSRLGDLDTHRDAEVRQALEPLAALADRASMAILGIIHHNKSGSSDPLQIVMGSKAFTAVSRSVHTVIPDPDDDTGQRRLFGTPKNNLGRSDLPTFSFTITGHPVDTDEGVAWTGKLEWGEQLEGSIDEVMRRAEESTEDRGATSEAVDWLSDYMTSQGGQVASADAKKIGRIAGHAERTLKRAASKLRLIVTSSGFPRATFWEIPVKQMPPSGVARAGGPADLAQLAPLQVRGDISLSLLSLSEHKNSNGSTVRPVGPVGPRFQDPTREGPTGELPCYRCGGTPIPGRGICQTCESA